MVASPAAYAFTSPSRVFFADARSAIVARPSLWKQTQLCGQTGLSPADDDLDPHEGRGQSEQRTITMTRSRILATLVALLALAGTASARIQVEPVERDGRDLIPIAMDFGFEQGGGCRGKDTAWQFPPTAA